MTFPCISSSVYASSYNLILTSILFSSSVAQNGQPCQLDAMIKGKPKPLVEWYKDTRALVERDGLRFLQEGNIYSLYIPEVKIDGNRL